MNTAPFTITHHDEGLSWDDSSVLKGLVNATVVVATREGYIFDGEIIHLEIEAEGEDEALRLGSQELHTLDDEDGLANCCEFLDIEIALTDDYYLGETE